MNSMQLSFYESLDKGKGTLVVHGATDLEATMRHNPLRVIWTTVRKRIAEQSGLSIVAFFERKPDSEDAITGEFYLSCTDSVSIDDQIARFEQNFHKHMAFFEGVVNKFYDYDNGYATYLRVKEELKDEPEEIRNAACKAVIQKFLKDIKLRKDEDEDGGGRKPRQRRGKTTMTPPQNDNSDSAAG